MTGTSPCKTACPAHIAVQGYLKLAAQGRYKEALQVIKRENPFPAVCGRICNRRCEDACTRGTVDRAIAIDEVKRFIAQKDLDAESRFVPEKVIPKVVGEFDEKIAIIGGGPAGLTCAYYLAEKDVVSAEIDIIRQLGVEFRCGVEVSRDVTIQQLREQGYKAFFLAIGAQGARMAGIPGEDGDGVISAVDLMYNLSIDENEKLPGRTVVIGGGNVATDVARAAMRAGSESVSLFCLESRENMPISVEEIDESEKEGISINNAWGPAEICLNDGKVQAVRFKKCLSTTDGNGSFAPRYDEDDTVTVECDNVVLAIGQRIIWGNLLKGTAVQLNPNGTVVADPVTLQTAEPDIFAGGDAITGPKWTIDAIASGKEGSVSLHRFVQPHSSLTIGRNLRKFIELDKTTTAIPVGFDNTPRQLPGYDEALRKAFRDGHIGFTEEQVKKETGRCLGCGASVVDPNKCIGCGQCTTKCVFDAIHLHREHPECSRMNPVEDMVKKVIPYELKRQVKIKLNSLSGTK